MSMEETRSPDSYIGKVSAVEKHPATVDEFFFWTQPDVILSPFDVVVVEREDGSTTYGVIEEISHITDSDSFMASYISNDFGDINCPMNTERVGLNYVRAEVIGNNRNIYSPVHNGDKVAVGTEEDIIDALGLLKKDSPKSIACGYLEMYQDLAERKVELPIYVNSDFLVGPEGAHLNISGISGLASKTSYAMFLLNALQQKSIKDTSARGTAFIFLNVKGRDLLTIDQAAEEGEDGFNATDIKMYDVLGLERIPFRNVKYYYPCKGRDGVGSHVRTEVYKRQCRAKCAKRFAYSYEDDKDNIDLLFSNVDDPQQTMESIVNYIVSEQAPFNKVQDWRGMLEEIDQLCQPGSRNNEISVMSWRKFKRIIRKAIENNDLFSNDIDANRGDVRLEEEIKRIKRNDVYVVDIAQQDENMQAFVFGTVMEAVQKLKLGDFDDDLGGEKKDVPDRIVIFVDELNKYASTDTPKSSPILHRLLEIAERGRSLGIVLFSAEQFKSAIHPRITGNCAMHAYGRTNSIEVSTKSYSFVPPTYKNMMTRLNPGQYIIQNPIFRSLLKVRFPRPLYHQDKGETK